MNSVILITKIERTVSHKHFVRLDKIISVEVPKYGTTLIRVYFDNDVWEVPRDEFDYIMHDWASHYTHMEKYIEYKNA